PGQAGAQADIRPDEGARAIQAEHRERPHPLLAPATMGRPAGGPDRNSGLRRRCDGWVVGASMTARPRAMMPGVTWTAPAVERIEEPKVGDERTILDGYLDWH